MEARPWTVTDAVRKLQKMGAAFHRTVYYRGSLLDAEDRDILIKKYKEATEMEVDMVHSMREFVDRMEELCQDPELVFLIDYDLEGNMSIDHISDRINVRYALEKEKNGDTGRFWFYTTGGSDVQETLLRNLGERLVPFGHCMLCLAEKTDKEKSED